jgi:hypothetical protein
MAAYRSIFIACSLALAAAAVALFWPSKKFVSIANPAELSSKAEHKETAKGETADSRGAAILDAAIKHWPRYPELLRASKHPGYFIERKADEYWIVSIGDNLSPRFHSWEILRVWKSGQIDGVNVSNGTWLLEYRPGK